MGIIINNPYTCRLRPPARPGERFHVTFGWDDGASFICSGTPSRGFKTLAGAKRAMAQWNARNLLATNDLDAEHTARVAAAQAVR